MADTSTKAKDRVWFVTGASRGLGRALVEAVMAGGERVMAVTRSTAAADEITEAGKGSAQGVVADVTRPEEVRAAVGQACARFGGIDVLVNNAGYSLLAAVEEATDDEIRRQFATNTFGLFDVTRAVLPVMRAQGSGFIVMISSVAGVSAAAGFAYYAASKHAVEGFSEALSKEIAPLGIRLSIVEPGTFRTDALGSSLSSSRVDDGYEPTVGRFRRFVGDLNGRQPGDPGRFADSIIRLADLPEPPLRLPLDPGATPAIRPKLENQLNELSAWAPRFATDPLGTPG